MAVQMVLKVLTATQAVAAAGGPGILVAEVGY